ncbi:MAG: hypothetical protein MUC58_04940 [Rhizobiaceae bacterium]|jgi:hypothetical protein|nr:hypothetical protein [Rhizobiaceae bacterium]
MTTKMCAGFVGVMLAMATAFSTPARANGVPHHDSNLERWAMERVAARIGGLRDAIRPSDPLVLVSAEMVARGPVPLNQLPLDDERALFAAFGISAETGFNFPARLVIERQDAPEQLDSYAVASVRTRPTYDGAFLTIGN